MAAVRLERLRHELTAKIKLVWKAYPLVLDDFPGHRFDGHLAHVWSRAGEEEPTLTFRPWPESQDLPSSSLPALEAAKCAELQGRDGFDRYHRAIFRAFFEQCRDISSREVLMSLAGDVGLDVVRLDDDLNLRKGESDVLADYRDGRQSEGILGIPTAIFTEELRLEGAVPLDMYRRAVEVLLKGESSK